jgi:integration host factor subunit alpha
MTLRRKELTEAVHDKADLSRTECRDLIDQMIAEVIAALARGEKVGISSFGAFIVRHVGQRVGRNPKTGAPANVPARRAIWFRPSGKLKAKITKG